MNDATGAIMSAPKRPRVPFIGKLVDNIDVKRIRLASGNMGATQRTFAGAIGVPVTTLRNWEQGRRKPTGPALILLKLIERDPWIVFDVMSGQHQPAGA